MGCPRSKCRKGDNASRLSSIELFAKLDELVRKSEYFQAIFDYLAHNPSEMSIKSGDKIQTFPTAAGSVPDWVFGAVIKDSSIDIGFCPRKLLVTSGCLEAEPYFFGAIGQMDAENILKNSTNGTFLIRINADGMPQLCVSYGDLMKKYDILAEQGKAQTADRDNELVTYYLDSGRRDRFSSIPELVNYLKNNKVICTKLLTSPPKIYPPFAPLLPEIQQQYQKIPRDQIEIMGKLDEGNNASIYKGIWNPPGKERLQVALKVINRDNSAEVAFKKFIREAAIMVGLQHPNLMKLHGVVIDKMALFMVIEYIKGETLRDFLRRMHKERRWLKEKQLVEILCQIAKIMDHLHGKLFTHNDLTSLNVMVDAIDEDGAPASLKIIDFGISKVFNLANPSTKQEAEALKGLNKIGTDRVLSWNDVRTFGRLVYNICAHGDEMEVGVKPEKFTEIIISDFPKCNWTKNGPNKLYELAMDCPHCDAKDRPSFKEIVARLQNFYE